jgi:Zn-dependent peptidase ImmA (M78 family)/DNA-binding XRE family transcriptional regulator
MKHLMAEISDKLNPQMVTLARESRGLTQRDLAAKLSLSAGKLSLVEMGDQSFTAEILEKLSEVLKYPVDFFYQKGEAHVSNPISYRRRAKVPGKVLMPIEAQISIYRMNLEIFFQNAKIPSPKIPVTDLKKLGSPEEAAKQIRKQWKIPKGPLKNITELIEGKGIPVISFDFGTDRVDSMTILTESKHPAIVLNSRLLGDRQRFSLAFELGHIAMHAFTTPTLSDKINHEANVFAAELLMPADDIKPDLEDNVNIPRLGELKQKWKVSMHALLYRASDLELITQNQQRYILEHFNKLKIRKREPEWLDLKKEKPLLLRDLITSYRRAQKMSVKEMASLLHLSSEDFLEKYK